MSIVIFIISGVVIGFVGTRMTGMADRLADRTGLGEALTGAVLLGASTSLPGITASVVAAIDGFPSISLSNAFGGIAAQTVFLAVADISYRKINLEHAAASVDNMMQGALLISLLSMILIAMVIPPVSFWGIHPVTPILFLSYIMGIRMIHKTHQKPMWYPKDTKETIPDITDEAEAHKYSLKRMWSEFIISAVLVIAAGWALTDSAEKIAETTGIKESIIGGFLIAVVTSLPELVTSVAAVKRGALTLAVGGILGGNAFDTLFAAVADVVYRGGSIYNAATNNEIIILAITILMTSILLLGLLRREKKGIGNIGFESTLLLVIYFVGLIIIYFSNT